MVYKTKLEVLFMVKFKKRHNGMKQTREPPSIQLYTF